MKKLSRLVTLATAVAMLLVGTTGCIIETRQPITVKNQYEEVIWDFFYEKLGNPYGVAGLMANLYAESSLKPTNLQNSFEKKLGMNDQEYTEAVDNGTYDNFIKDGAGYGIAQWTFWSRKQGLYDYAKKQGKSIGDINIQLEYLWKELQGYKSVIETLKTAEDVKTASDIVLVKFEKPANMSDSVKNAREAFGNKYFDKYGEKYV